MRKMDYFEDRQKYLINIWKKKNIRNSQDIRSMENKKIKINRELDELYDKNIIKSINDQCVRWVRHGNKHERWEKRK